MTPRRNTKFLSISRVLNTFFPTVDIENINVQKGIVRGKYLDQSIENWFSDGDPQHPSVRLLGISVKNLLKVDFEVLEKQCTGCWNAFLCFKRKNFINIEEVQKTVTNNQDQLLGIIDALIKIGNQKYIIDWKSKGKYTDYTKVNYEDIYREYLDWCSAMQVRGKSYDVFLPERKATNHTYNLGNFRYLLQVTFYWYLMKNPPNYELLIGYFTAEGKYHIYTFDKHKALKIALVLLKYARSSDKMKNYFRDKIAKFNWTEILNWRQVY